MTGLASSFPGGLEVGNEGDKKENSVDNRSLCLILQAGQNREVTMSKWPIWALFPVYLLSGLVPSGVEGVVFAQSNLYTFPGPDVDLGPGGTFSSGFHYIGGRGDTIYVLRVTTAASTFCHKSTDGGRTFSSGVQVNSTPAGFSPSLKLDTAGVVYVAYQSGDADIYFTKSTDGGQNFIPAVKVNDDTIPQTGQEKPAIAVNNKGHIFIAWIDKRLARWTIFTSASYDSGRYFTSNVNVDTTLRNRADPDILADDNGNVYVAYAELLSDVRQITVALSRDSGQSFSAHAFASDLPNDGSSCCAVNPSMASNGNGLIGVAWWEDRNNSVTLRFSSSNNFGQGFSPSIIIDTSGYPQYPSLVWKHNIFYFVWRATHQRTPSGPYFNHIWFSYSRDTGKTFVPLVDAVPDDTNDVNHSLPSIWVNETEKAFVAWSDARWGTPYGSNLHLFVSAGKPVVAKGDLNFDGLITLADVALELNAVFLKQPFPAPFHRADGNCSGKLTPADVSLLLFRAYLNQPFPCE